MCVVFHGTYPTDNIYMIYYDILCLIQVLLPYINKILQSPGQNMVVPNVSRLLWWSFHHCWWKRPGKRLEMSTTIQDSGSYSYHTYHNIRMQRDFHWINWNKTTKNIWLRGWTSPPPKKTSYFQPKKQAGKVLGCWILVQPHSSMSSFAPSAGCTSVIPTYSWFKKVWWCYKDI